MAAKRTILHPTDFSANSSQAFDVAVELARNRGAKLVVMHVAPRPLTTLGGAEAIPPSSDELALGEAKATLAKFRPVEGVQLETKLEVGEAAPSIVRFARDAGCELIVMGTHGRGGLERLILGSVAEHVLRQAPCPVLTVRQAPAGAKP